MHDDQTQALPPESDPWPDPEGEQWNLVMGEYDQQTSTAPDTAPDDEDAGDSFGTVDVSDDDIKAQLAEHQAAANDPQKAKAAVVALQREFAREIDRMKAAAQNPLAPQPAEGGVLLVGLDAEWEQLDKDNNVILCVQLHVPPQPCFRQPADRDEVDRKRVCKQIASLSRILYAKGPAKDQRPRLKPALLDLVARAIELKLMHAEPSRIEVVGFGNRFDLPALGDFNEIKTQVDSAAGKLMSVHADTSIVLDWGQYQAERRKARQAERPAHACAQAPASMRENLIVASGAGSVRIAVRFIDTMAYVPPGTSLRTVGEMLSLPKLDIPAPYSIERMSEFLKGDRAAFEAYAMRDAEIAVKYFMEIQQFARERLGVTRMPATASGLALRWFLDGLTREEWLRVFGLHRVRRERWDVKKQRYLSKTQVEPVPMRAIFTDLLTKCYHGGRNESLTLGPTDPALGTITDFDLAGAYSTGLVDVPAIDFDNPEPSKSLQDFLDHKVGFALVEFEHPPDIRVSVFPVRDGDRGLVFPLKGESYTTAPEIKVAHALGVTMRVRMGVYYPTIDTGKPEDRPFYPFVKRVREMRDEFKREEKQRAEQAGEKARKSLKEGLVKLLGNSLYGRTCQGVRPKNAYDARGQAYVELRPCAITNPAIASHITGFVRAVLAEILNRIPREQVIASVTTDGFLTSADVEDIDLSGPMCQRYQQLCDWVLPGSPMLEVKHRVGQVLAMKTRGQLTTRIEAEKPEFKGMGQELDEIVLAKAGVQPQVKTTRDMSGEIIRRLQNEAMLDMYLSRTNKSQVTVRSFPAIRDQVEKGTEMIKLSRQQRMSLEPDMKRRLVNPRELLVVSRGVTHLAADSVPWTTAAEFGTARACLERFREKNVMKTSADFQLYETMLVEALARSDARRQGRGVLNGGKDGALGKLRRAFLRAAVKGALGVTIDLSGRVLAEKLSSLGLPTNIHHVKDAGRANAKLIQHGVPRTPEVMALCAVLVDIFPGVDVEQLLIPAGR